MNMFAQFSDQIQDDMGISSQEKKDQYVHPTEM